MLTLIWRQSARHELRAIIDYISDLNELTAKRLQAAITDGAERLPQFPYLVYRVAADAIEILNVTHARREYP